MSPRQRDRVRSLIADADTPIDAQTVAAALSVHVTTARFHLNNLVEEGSAVAVGLPPVGVGRPRVGYRLVVAPPIDDLMLMLIARLGATPEEREELAAEVGHAWAAKHLPTTDLGPDVLPDPVVLAETILTRLGFRITDVVSAFGQHEISLCGCPLEELEKDLPEVARGVVRGLLEATLAAGSATLSSHYAVQVRPAPGGACELRLNLSQVAEASSSH
ncbi:hypothetical protein ACFQNE_12970 [Gordonia phosphorivorans]|uniref:Transcriptional regulator n=1 Tax=Gordonia phosphorivorans TaxID=1056982 RepID=A0ABV6H6T8_9ACTN